MTKKRRLSESVNGRMLDRAVRHQHALLRYGNTLTREVVGFLNAEVFPDLLGRLTARLEKIKLRGFDDSGPHSTARYAALLTDLGSIIDDGTDQARKEVVNAAKKLAKVESAWQLDTLAAESPEVLRLQLPDRINVAMVRAVVDHPIQGLPQQEWWDKLNEQTQTRLRSAIGIGLAQGETVDQIVQRVRGTKANGFRDGVLEATRRQAESIVRTSTTHISAQAREATFAAMPDVVARVQWVSTLDTRTTPVCMGLDGQTFPVGEGPRPPAHWGCRSTIVPVVKSLREILGKTPKDVPESTRASMDGQVSDRLTYGDWLEQQPAARQDEALGVSRARLFRAGKIGVEDLAARDGRTLTLEELAAT